MNVFINIKNINLKLYKCEEYYLRNLNITKILKVTW